MTKTEYAAYLQSPHWKAKRAEAIRWAGNMCAKCEAPRWLVEIAYDQDLNVHHLSYASLGNEPMDDLECLCRRCHEVETFGRSSLRAIKQSPCEACMEIQFDYRSRFCPICREIRESLNYVAERIYNLPDPKDVKDMSPWSCMFVQLVRWEMLRSGVEYTTSLMKSILAFAEMTNRNLADRENDEVPF